MKLSTKAIANSAKSMFYRSKFFIRKNSPQILTGAGIALGVTSTVMACKATLKVTEVIEYHETMKQNIEDSVGGKLEDGGTYTRELADADQKILVRMTAWKVIKLYAPAVGVGALGITSILYGHKILSKRNASLAAAYQLLDKGFKEYRQNVRDRYGDEVDKELRYGLVKEKIEEETVDPETGKKKKTKKEVTVLPDGRVPSVYARIFDELNDNWEKDSELNLFFINGQLNYWNHILQTRGYVFLNEVYKALGFDPTKAGQHVGWYYDAKNPKADNYIDFGIYDVNRRGASEFVNGMERSVILDFNVQGPIDSLIGEEI